MTSKMDLIATNLVLLKTSNTGKVFFQFKIDDFQSLVRANLDEFLNAHDLFID